MNNWIRSQNYARWTNTYTYTYKETRSVDVGVGDTHADPLVTLVPARNQVTRIKLTYIPLSSVLSPLIKRLLTAWLYASERSIKDVFISLSFFSLQPNFISWYCVFVVHWIVSFLLLCVTPVIALWGLNSRPELTSPALIFPFSPSFLIFYFLSIFLAECAFSPFPSESCGACRTSIDLITFYLSLTRLRSDGRDGNNNSG